MGAAFIALMVARAGEASVFLQDGQILRCAQDDMVYACGEAIVFHQGVSQGNWTRTTIKAHPTPHPPPSPLWIAWPPA